MEGENPFIDTVYGSLQSEIQWSSSDSLYSAKICPWVVLIV